MPSLIILIREPKQSTRIPKCDIELLMFLGLAGLNGGNVFFECPRESKLLLESVVQQGISTLTMSLVLQ